MAVNPVMIGPSKDLGAAIRDARPVVRSALERALEGRELGFDEGVLLAQADGDDLTALVAAADELRRRQVGDAITYVVNRNINFTNVCMVSARALERDPT